MENQTTIFEMLYPTYKIKKPIRTIEFFAGYGSTKLAWNYLGIDVKSYKICEWAVKSIQAYKDIHFTDDNFDYSWCYENKEDIVDYLYEQGISSNYNEPMTKQQISRLNEKQLRTIYNNICATHNLVNIQTICGEDLEIVDTDKYEYILTYSFPCQDLSLAGKQKGMSDTSTRSGMLWEVERILTECHKLGTMPQILLMENVPMIHSSDNVEDFNKWQLRLEELGYKNYWQDLIATDYGIPQTRNRTFMVSILGDYNYTFPKPIPLKLKLKDMLEDEVDEKYYLSDKMLNYICSRMPTGNNKITTGINIGNRKSFMKAGTLTTGEGSKPSSNYLIDNEEYDYSKSKGKIIKIKNATAKGYLEATDGDGIDISSRMEYHRGTVQKDKTQTLSTMGGENNGVVLNDLRIRKLTPRECFRLMGVRDEDYDKVAKNQSDSSLYHLAGDSICTSCLMALFSQLLNISWEDKLWNIKNTMKKENT